MLTVRLAGDHLYGKLLFTWLSLVVSMLVSFYAAFFQRDILDEILDLAGQFLWVFLPTLACLVVQPIKANNFAYLFDCTTVGRPQTR